MKKLTSLLYVTILMVFMGCLSGSKTSEKPFEANPQMVEKQEVTTLAIGDAAPDFYLPDVSGKFYSLQSFEKAGVLVVVFTCNHCPTAQAYEDRLIKFTKEYKDKSVQVVAISPNSGLGLLLEECGYSDLNDSYEEMKIRAAHKGFNFPYLYDGDKHEASLKYGPVSTPHVFVFDKERKLQYAGRIDDKEKPGTGHAEDLIAAVEALLKNEAVKNPLTKTFGCSVKWAWKSDWVQKVNRDWEEKAVTLEEIDEGGIAGLLKNDTENLRLINVWATWCAPCVIEYPELVKLQRMYGNRNFEFVSISADNIENEDKVQEFLEKSNSAIANYISSIKDKYRLIESIDPEWDGALPYTILIEPGGKVIFKHQGIVDLLELKRKVAEHNLLGRYY